MNEACYDHASTATSPWCIFVAAHNEERKIALCLKSVFAAAPEARPDVYVMANGCTDETEARVLEFKRNHASVHLVTIRRGDKCNAWNVFVHDVIPRYCQNRDAYFFMDGDVTMTPGSLGALAVTLADNPYAHGAAGLPVSGRSMKQTRERLIALRNISGNLYALRGDFVRRIQQRQIRLPRGLEGEDGLVASLAKFDLSPRMKRSGDGKRIAPCPGAGFQFDSLRLLSIRDWRIYYKRMIRYSRRQFEFDLLRLIIKRSGFEAMPAEIAELYCDVHMWRSAGGLHTVWNWLASRDIRRRAHEWELRSETLHESSDG